MLLAAIDAIMTATAHAIEEHAVVGALVLLHIMVLHFWEIPHLAYVERCYKLVFSIILEYVLGYR